MHDAELADGNLFLDEVDVELDVLGVLVMYGVAGHAHRRDAVAVCHRSLRDGAMELAEQMPEPDALSCRVLHRLVFSISASALERDTAGCRLEDQETSESPRNT